MDKRTKNISNCLNIEDKGNILINLDESIRCEESKIIRLQEIKENMIISGDINYPRIEELDRFSELHYRKIAGIKGLISKIENTESCDE